MFAPTIEGFSTSLNTIISSSYTDKKRFIKKP